MPDIQENQYSMTPCGELIGGLEGASARTLRCGGRLLSLEKPVVMGSLTKAQFDMEIQKGFDDAANGNIYSADVVEKEMNALYDV